MHKRDRGAEVRAEIRGRKVLREGAETRLRRWGERKLRDLPGGLVVKTLRSQCRGPRFNPWWGN